VPATTPYSDRHLRAGLRALLCLPQRRIATATCEQGFVPALFHELTVFQYQYSICVDNGRKAMCYYQCGVVPGKGAKRLHNGAF